MAATADRVFSVFELFTVDQPEWTVEAIASRLQLSTSTAYQYVGSLVKAGFLVPGIAGIYMIGPAVTVFDRTVRMTDPLTCVGRDVLRQLVDDSGERAIGLTCRLYHQRVICIHQYAPRPPDLGISYERGRPMSLLAGASSKVILAHLPVRTQRSFFDADTQSFVAAGLGPDWKAFKSQMLAIRRTDALLSIGEVVPGAMGIAAPIMGMEKAVLGSIGLVVEEQAIQADPERLQRLKMLVAQAGEAVGAALRTSWESRGR
ncbi:IclR family transcriptional regulator [Novosphingobium sp. Rr 2-17]|uniref:IclR family transcriptional regulator n=1 Tax=Novosphingobium sp. Rr 2-17 TaxID=555793 RepID=UPI000269A4CE|nr:IclR family transcriptional regulator C-terminal domain-containing protein [Novosphingobium sp. Rr 2-17]EIZ80116.1 IclR family transcriptional regulator [Novosphingobium sp. Rr 2-17]